MLEQDSDVYQWGQSIFDENLFSNPGYPTEAIHQDASSIYHVHSPLNHYGTEYSTVENDEIIVHDLEEDFSHLAIRETSENFHVQDENSSILSDHQQDWHSPSMIFYYSGA